MKLTKKTFAGLDDTVRKLRRTDPYQFNVLFEDWKRLREDHQEAATRRHNSQREAAQNWKV